MFGLRKKHTLKWKFYTFIDWLETFKLIFLFLSTDSTFFVNLLDEKVFFCKIPLEINCFPFFIFIQFECHVYQSISYIF